MGERPHQNENAIIYSILWDHFGVNLCVVVCFELCYRFCYLGIYVLGIRKRTEHGTPMGGDMQSDHACACFVRVGGCRRGSILGSILVAFSALYSFWVALVTKTGLKKSISKNCIFGEP